MMIISSRLTTLYALQRFDPWKYSFANSTGQGVSSSMPIWISGIMFSCHTLFYLLSSISQFICTLNGLPVFTFSPSSIMIPVSILVLTLLQLLYAGFAVSLFLVFSGVICRELVKRLVLFAKTALFQFNSIFSFVGDGFGWHDNLSFDLSSFKVHYSMTGVI